MRADSRRASSSQPAACASHSRRAGRSIRTVRAARRRPTSSADVMPSKSFAACDAKRRRQPWSTVTVGGARAGFQVELQGVRRLISSTNCFFLTPRCRPIDGVAARLRRFFSSARARSWRCSLSGPRRRTARDLSCGCA